MLGTLTGELDKLAPRFEIRASQIQILQAPDEFYSTLKVIGEFSPHDGPGVDLFYELCFPTLHLGLDIEGRASHLPQHSLYRQNRT
jgi:hypothetical protein